MEVTNFQLQRKCVVLYDNTNGVNLFFTDGFNILEAFEEFNYIKSICVKEAFIERGIGITYQQVNTDILSSCVSMLDLINHLRSLPKDIFIYSLELESTEISITIYDNRDFTIRYNKSENLFKDILLKLFISCFKFSPETSYYILNEITQSPDLYFLIDDSGMIIGKYKNIEECYA
ncbi:MAG: hypothetical protein IT270_00385 [Saprospiraceae bacterium]|nr:hypothetical protein [Saprospiraceae bacterium]